MSVVTFNYADWVAAYPVFSTVTEPAALSYFNRACLQLDNTDGSIVSDIDRRTSLLYLLTAHIAFLSSPTSAASQGIVGRISKAQQGSVSVEAILDATAGAAYYDQSPYGVEYWNATRAYRTAQYRAPAARVFSPWGLRRRW